MKEFVVYTGLRLLLFVSSFLVIGGVWALFSDEDVNLLIPLLGAMVLSAIGSYYLLKGPRERFAAKIEERANRAASKFDEMRSKEDAD